MDFYTLDVFTDRALAGNPLAVVLSGRDLSSGRMQAIAAEFNLSETVFVLPPDDGDHRARLRIFTPQNELPFAGHPTVGAAVLLAHLDGSDGAFTLEEEVGPVRVEVDANRAVFQLPKLPTRTTIDVDIAKLAGALSLEPDDLGMKGHNFAVCDAGNAFPCMPVRSVEALGRAKVSQSALTKFNRAHWLRDEIYLYTKPDNANGFAYQARMFAPALGIPEDPATGSAVASLSAQIAACEILPDGKHEVTVDQGIEMGRPSRIDLTIEIENGLLCAGSIGGNAVIVSRGKLLI